MAFFKDTRFVFLLLSAMAIVGHCGYSRKTSPSRGLPNNTHLLYLVRDVPVGQWIDSDDEICIALGVNPFEVVSLEVLEKYSLNLCQSLARKDYVKDTSKDILRDKKPRKKYRIQNYGAADPACFKILMNLFMGGAALISTLNARKMSKTLDALGVSVEHGLHLQLRYILDADKAKTIVYASDEQQSMVDAIKNQKQQIESLFQNAYTAKVRAEAAQKERDYELTCNYALITSLQTQIQELKNAGDSKALTHYIEEYRIANESLVKGYSTARAKYKETRKELSVIKKEWGNELNLVKRANRILQDNLEDAQAREQQLRQRNRAIEDRKTQLMIEYNGNLQVELFNNDRKRAAMSEIIAENSMLLETNSEYAAENQQLKSQIAGLLWDNEQLTNTQQQYEAQEHGAMIKSMQEQINELKHMNDQLLLTKKSLEDSNDRQQEEIAGLKKHIEDMGNRSKNYEQLFKISLTLQDERNALQDAKEEHEAIIREYIEERTRLYSKLDEKDSDIDYLNRKIQQQESQNGSEYRQSQIMQYNERNALEEALLKKTSELEAQGEELEQLLEHARELKERLTQLESENNDLSNEVQSAQFNLNTYNELIAQNERLTIANTKFSNESIAQRAEIDFLNNKQTSTEEDLSKTKIALIKAEKLRAQEFGSSEKSIDRLKASSESKKNIIVNMTKERDENNKLIEQLEMKIADLEQQIVYIEQQSQTNENKWLEKLAKSEENKNNIEYEQSEVNAEHWRLIGYLKQKLGSVIDNLAEEETNLSSLMNILVQVHFNEIKEAEQKISNSAARINDLEDDLKNMQNGVYDDYDTELSKCRKANEQYGVVTRDFHAKVNHLNDEINKRDADILNLKEDQRRINNALEKSREDTERLEIENNRLATGNATCGTNLTRVKKLLRDNQGIIKEKDEQILTMKKESETIASNINKLNLEKADLENSRNALQTANNDLTESLESFKSYNLDLHAELQKFYTSLQPRNQPCDTHQLQNRNELLQREVEELKATIQLHQLKYDQRLAIEEGGERGADRPATGVNGQNIDEITGQLDSLRTMHDKLKEQHRQVAFEKNMLENKLVEQQNLNAHLAADLEAYERMSQAWSNEHAYLDGMQKNYTTAMNRLKSEHATEMARIKGSLLHETENYSQIAETNESLGLQLIGKNSEIEKLKASNGGQTEKLKELTGKVEMLGIEKLQMEKINKNLSQQLMELGTQLGVVEGKSANIEKINSDLEANIAYYKSQMDALIKDDRTDLVEKLALNRINELREQIQQSNELNQQLQYELSKSTAEKEKLARQMQIDEENKSDYDQAHEKYIESLNNEKALLINEKTVIAEEKMKFELRAAELETIQTHLKSSYDLIKRKADDNELEKSKEIKSLETRLRASETMNKQMGGKVTDYEQKIGDLERSLIKMSSTSDGDTAIWNEYNNEIKTLEAQNNKLKDLVSEQAQKNADLDADLEELYKELKTEKSANQKYEEELSCRTLELETTSRKMQIEKDDLERRNGDLQANIDQLQTELRKRMAELEEMTRTKKENHLKTITELQEKIDLLVIEKESIDRSYQDVLKDQTHLRNQLKAMESDDAGKLYKAAADNQIKELQQQIKTLDGSNQELSRNIVEFKANETRLMSELEGEKNTNISNVQELNSSIALAQRDISGLKESITSSNKTIDELRKENKQLEAKITEFNAQKAAYEDLASKQTKSYTDRISELDGEKVQLLSRAQEAAEEINQLTTRADYLQNELKQIAINYKNAVDSKEREINDLKSEKEVNAEKAVQLEKQLAKSQMTESALNMQLVKKAESIDEMLRKITALQADAEKSNDRQLALDGSIRALQTAKDNLKTERDDFEAKLKSETENIIQRESEYVEKMGNLEKKIIELNSEMKAVERKNSDLTQTIDILNTNIRQQNNGNDNRYLSQIDTLRKEKEDAHKKLDNLKAEVDMLSGKIDQQSQQLIAEKTASENTIQLKTSEISSLQSRMGDLQSEIERTSSEYIKLNKEKVSLEAKRDSLEIELQTITETYERNLAEIDKIKLNNHSMRIDINNEQKINAGLSKEVAKLRGEVDARNKEYSKNELQATQTISLLKQQLRNVQDTKISLESAIEEIEADKKKLIEKHETDTEKTAKMIKTHIANIENLERQILDLQSIKMQAEEDNKQLEKKLSLLNQENDTLNELNVKTQNELEKKLNADISKFRNGINALLKVPNSGPKIVSDLDNLIADMKAKDERKQRRINTLVQLKNSLTVQITELETQKSICESEITEKETKFDEMWTKYDQLMTEQFTFDQTKLNLEHKSANLEREKSSLIKERTTTKKELEKLRNEINSLKKDNDDLTKATKIEESQISRSTQRNKKTHKRSGQGNQPKNQEFNDSALKNDVLLSENHKKLLKERTAQQQQIDALRKRQSELENDLQTMDAIQQTNDRLKTDISILQSKLSPLNWEQTQKKDLIHITFTAPVVATNTNISITGLECSLSSLDKIEKIGFFAVGGEIQQLEHYRHHTGIKFKDSEKLMSNVKYIIVIQFKAETPVRAFSRRFKSEAVDSDSNEIFATDGRDVIKEDTNPPPLTTVYGINFIIGENNTQTFSPNPVQNRLRAAKTMI